MDEESHGTITIAPNVLTTIARLTTLNVDGVARLGTSGQLLQSTSGIAVKLIDGRVKADIYIVVKSDTNFFEVGQKIQHEVARSIKEIVGMDVEAVNIHIQEVAYAAPAADPAQS